MRKLVIIASTIGLAAICAHKWNAVAQEGVPRPTETLPAKPPSVAPRYQMFFEGGTPTRPSTSIKTKEAGGLKGKEEPKKGKVDAARIRPPGLLATPNVTLDSIPPTAENNDYYRVKVRFPWLPPGNDGWASVGTTYGKGSTQQTKQSDDDAALNAAACKAAAAKRLPLPSFCRQKAIQVDRLSYDRLETDRFDQLGAGGPGGFSPNKP
ncbi:MAG: hypothetical protein WD207_07135 [Xanthobacteraceae bacterium]